MTWRVLAIVAIICAGPMQALAAPEVRIEHMTWLEVRAAIDAGKTTVIVPTGGTEQNGAHMVIGKHNFIVAETARRIAEKLDNALVAPVLAYVPEGPPGKGHMKFAGTISLPDDVFEDVLQATAESLRSHGFTTIALLGDSGGNQAAQQRVATRLTRQWRAAGGAGLTVVSVSDYYDASRGREWLRQHGETAETIGTHAGIEDTSQLLAVMPSGVDLAKASPTGGNGATGDATRASKQRGQHLLKLRIDAAVEQIRAAQRD